MKKLLVIAIAFFTLTGIAQEKRKHKADRKGGAELRKQMTHSEIADLKSKKMTLDLDLTDAQQKEVYTVVLNQVKENESLRKERRTEDGKKREKPSKEEFMKLQNRRLDQRIEMKREMKTILTPEQYAKYEKMKPRKKRKKRGHKKDRR